MVNIEKQSESTFELSDAGPVVHILSDRCSGCQECIVRCPAGALTLNSDEWIATADNSLCVGCRQCERTCPFSAIFVEGPTMVPRVEKKAYLADASVLGSLAEIDVGFDGLNELSRACERCLQCPDPTCVKGCPAHNDIPGFIRAAQEGDFEKAREIISLNSCLPGACSRVCDWSTQCEGACSWTLAGGESVEIGKIERYIADHQPAPALEIMEENGLRVAIIGSGPGGLGAAYELRKGATAVTIFERDSEPGGVMRWGIPSYVLSRESWFTQVDELRTAGVEFKFNSEISSDSINELLNEYDAVICASGANEPIMPQIPGLDAQGVVSATEFLGMAKSLLDKDRFRPILAGKNVLVIGAGNSALDVARSALRLGGKAVAIDWTDERYSKARPDEISDAREEGVEVRFLTTASRLVPNSAGKVVEAELFSTAQIDRNSLPTVVPRSGQLFEVDLVVLAMGYRVGNNEKKLSNTVKLGTMPQAHRPIDRKWLGSGLFAGSNGSANLAYDREYSRVESAFPISDRVWASGDVRIGPSTVVSAMAQGMSAARGVLAELKRHSAQGSSNSTVGKDLYVGSILLVHDGTSDLVTKAADHMERVLWGAGWLVRQADISHLDPLEILGTDLLIFGSQSGGLVPGSIHPSRKAVNYIPQLPPLHGKKVVTFVIRSLVSGDPNKRLAQLLADKGVEVAATGNIFRRSLVEDAKKFAMELINIS